MMKIIFMSYLILYQVKYDLKYKKIVHNNEFKLKISQKRINESFLTYFLVY